MNIFNNKWLEITKNKVKQRSRIMFCLSSLIIATPALAGWEINFIDKFDGNGVNWQNWTAQIDANYNNEVQCYTDDDSSANKNFDVSDGTLKIIARKQQVNCAGLNNQSKSWTSGRINGKDKQEFLYGRIESRIRFHNLEGGTWPAFWMLENRIAESPRKNDNDTIHWPNPGAGEIDVWEWFSNSSTTYITNFFNTGGASCGNEVRFTYPNGASDVLDWHDYAIEWDENNISFYMDDTLVTSHNVSNCPQYKEPMFVLLNVAMGGNLGGNINPSLNKATMEVDYLAHCTATNKNTAKRCNESTPIVYTDDDNDGIPNELDQCPNSSEGEIVDNNGCLLDEDLDNDGILDDIDQCPNTPDNEAVNNVGCPLDEDNDGVANDIDQCANTPENESVNNIGCPLDEDNDGVANDIDQCANTSENEAVNNVGCPIVEVNIAPTITLSLTQNDVSVTAINLNNGLVEITANTTDANIDDVLSLSWIVGGAIPSPIINNETLSFDPTTMVAGSSHKIDVTVTDNGNPALSVSNSIEFSVEQNQISPPDEEPAKSSGGAIYPLLWLLLISLFTFVKPAKRSY